NARLPPAKVTDSGLLAMGLVDASCTTKNAGRKKRSQQMATMNVQCGAGSGFATLVISMPAVIEATRNIHPPMMNQARRTQYDRCRSQKGKPPSDSASVRADFRIRHQNERSANKREPSSPRTENSASSANRRCGASRPQIRQSDGREPSAICSRCSVTFGTMRLLALQLARAVAALLRQRQDQLFAVSWLESEALDNFSPAI